jgi:hypothetical protein
VFVDVKINLIMMQSENISAQVISNLDLRLSTELETVSELTGRVFEYPHIKNVYVMENDLYGNVMPEGSCFLAFSGKHGLIGKHIKIATLKDASIDDVRRLVENNEEG